MASLLKKADEGHNLLITGPPGTGKTHVLAQIVERFLIDGKQVAVTSTTGISATILKSKLTSIAGPDVPPVTTIHRFCGLADGRHQNEELVDLLMHSEYYDGYRINICTVQALIIDEISMLSCKLLHQIEHIFRRIRRVEKPFGGVQVVLAGDFLQLPPVPTPEYGDDGQSITESILLQYFHCEQLSEIFRQSEPDLIQAIHEIARGNLSKESENLILRLKRTLPPGETPMKLMSRRENVDIWNGKCLTEMDGEEKVYSCTDEGECSGLDIPKQLHLKIGCPVILTVNLSDTLVNGLTGHTVECKDKCVVVHFASVGNVSIMPYAFKKYDPYIKKDKGCRTQLPLKLGFAATIHKCQGMSLERVDIDCRGIFQYGQLVVAVSRATTKKGLRIQNFKKEYIQRPPANILRFYENVTKEYTDDNVCCTESFCNIDYDPVSTPFIASVTENDTSEEEGDEEAMLELIDSYSDNVEEHVELPAGVDIISAIETIKHASPANQIQENENLAVNYLKDHPDNVKQFVSKVWWKLVQYKTDAFKQDQIDNKAINSFYVKFNELLSSDLYKKDVTKLYDCLFTTVTMEQFNVAFQLVAYIRKKVVSEEVSTIKQKAEERAENERGKEFTESEGGRGKIRYLGGWCLSRIKNTIRKRIMDNVYKAKNVKLVNNLIVKKDMIEHLLVSESEITESSKFVESLHETCRRQNIRKGLTHISDDCFNFFKTLDREVRKLESNANLQLHGKNFPLFQKTELSNMPSVTTEWKELFVQCDVNVQASFIHEIFAEVIEKYLRMSNAQLRKDYMTSQHLKKSEATRKQIKMRTETAMKTVFNMTTIMNDTSNQKIISHRRLQSEVMKSNKFLVDKFKKTELQTLCAFYGVSYKSQQTKNALSEALIPVITAADNMDSHTATVSSTSCEPSSSGHVSGNKRKRTVTEYPCGVCLHDASSNSVGCDRCDKWFHGVCVGEDLDALSDSEWFCPKCRK